jgi:hypothetical protein
VFVVVRAGEVVDRFASSLYLITSQQRDQTNTLALRCLFVVCLLASSAHVVCAALDRAAFRQRTGVQHFSKSA